MRVVALEEHFSTPDLVRRIDPAIVAKRGFKPRKMGPNSPNLPVLLPEIGATRLAAMDEAGISQAVLSHGGPGADLLPGADGVTLAREINDHLAGKVSAHPRRFAGFTHLPMQSPDAAAAELARCVKGHGFVGAMVDGTIDGKFLDDARFAPLLAAAVELDVPLYLHPHLPPESVRQAYYSGLPDGADRVLSTAGWGWHQETAIHVLRLVVSGTLDKYPKLKLIVGHMGEMLPMMLARADHVFSADVDHLTRPVSATIQEQVWITTSGIFTQPPFLAALLTFGIDRIMFSVDYPFAENARGRAFLDSVTLSPADMAKLTHGNADALLKLKA